MENSREFILIQGLYLVPDIKSAIFRVSTGCFYLWYRGNHDNKSNLRKRITRVAPHRVSDAHEQVGFLGRPQAGIELSTIFCQSRCRIK